MELNIKHEPAVDYELMLPAVTEVKSENNNPFGIKPCSVNLDQFDAEWKHKSSIFAIYLACSHCKWISRLGGSLKAHEKACLRKQQNICEFCDKKFVSKHRFRVHINAKPIECQPCQVVFTCRTLWLKHTQGHHQQGFKCDRCSYVGKTKSLFDSHYRKHAKKFFCDTCDGRFGSKYKLKVHQVQHRHGVFENTEISFDCNQCDKAYQTQQSLNKHKLNRHQEKRLECDFCGKKFVTKQTIANHMQSHAKVDCKFCGKVLAESRMANHVNQEHIKRERSFSCKDCGKRFLDKCEYIRHINPKKQVDCPSCQIVFKCRNLWQKHLKEQHAEGLRCNQCSYVGQSRNNLKYHLMSHTKQFSCDSCHKKFATKLRLEDHQKNRSHGVFATVKDEALQCDKCEKAFRTKSSLRKHKKTSHEFKNFECDICGKTLKAKNNLTQHFRTHIFEKCEICKLSLTQSKIPNHLLKKHNKGDTSSRCNGCRTSFNTKRNLARHVGQRKKCVPCKIEFKCSGALSQHKHKIHKNESR